MLLTHFANSLCLTQAHQPFTDYQDMLDEWKDIINFKLGKGSDEEDMMVMKRQLQLQPMFAARARRSHFSLFIQAPALLKLRTALWPGEEFTRAGAPKKVPCPLLSVALQSHPIPTAVVRVTNKQTSDFVMHIDVTCLTS